MPHWSTAKTPKDLALGDTDLSVAALNYRAMSALNGNHARPELPLIELLRSKAPIDDCVREMLAAALEGVEPTRPRLKVVGAGSKSDAGLIAQRRDWLDIAEAFHRSGLSEPDFLRRSNMIDQRSRTLLQKAKAFHRAFCLWLKTDTARHEIASAGPYADEDDQRHFAQMAFSEWCVDSDLTSERSLREFLRDG